MTTVTKPIYKKGSNANLVQALLQLNLGSEKKEEKRTHKNSKLLEGINDNYIVFSDGRVYSMHYGGRFLEPYAYENRCKTSVHLGVCISFQKKGKKFYVARLVYFYFGKHNYKNIFEMPYITYKDGNSQNVSIDNLREAKPGEIIGKALKILNQGRNNQLVNNL